MADDNRRDWSFIRELALPMKPSLLTAEQYARLQERIDTMTRVRARCLDEAQRATEAGDDDLSRALLIAEDVIGPQMSAIADYLNLYASACADRAIDREWARGI